MSPAIADDELRQRAKCVKCGGEMPELPASWKHVVCETCFPTDEPRNTAYVAVSEEMKPVLADVLAEVARQDAGEAEYGKPSHSIMWAAWYIREALRLKAEGGAT